MRILVLDSCGSSCGVGVYRGTQVLARLEERMQRGQDARLMPMTVEAMAQSGCSFEDLDRIAVTKGPGSFTGVRVGLAAARGIGLAAGKPVIGIDRFSLYKQMAPMDRDVLVVLDSKRAELFCRFYPVQGAAHEPCMMTDDAIQGFLKEHPQTEVAGDLALPEADVLAVGAGVGLAADIMDPDSRPSAFYLRPPDVTFSKKS